MGYNSKFIGLRVNCGCCCKVTRPIQAPNVLCTKSNAPPPHFCCVGYTDVRPLVSVLPCLSYHCRLDVPFFFHFLKSVGTVTLERCKPSEVPKSKINLEVARTLNVANLFH